MKSHETTIFPMDFGGIFTIFRLATTVPWPRRLELRALRRPSPASPSSALLPLSCGLGPWPVWAQEENAVRIPVPYKSEGNQGLKIVNNG